MDRFGLITFIWLLVLSNAVIAATFETEHLMVQINSNVTEACEQNMVSRLRNFFIKQSQIEAKRLPKILYESKSALRLAMEPYGYFSPDISTQTTSLSPQKWQITYKIKPGKKVFVSGLSVSIPNDIVHQVKIEKEISMLLALNNHDYDGVTLRALRDKIIYKIQQGGYPFATFDEAYMKFIEPNKVVIRLKVNLNRRFDFGPIHIKNSQQLSDEFIKRFRDFKTGDPYNAVKVNQFQKNLIDSGYFQEVIVNPIKWEQQNNQVPVVVDVVDGKRTHTVYTIGYDDRYHVGGSIGHIIKPFNENGHILDWLIRLYTKNFVQIQANYLIPSKNPLERFYILSAQLLTQSLADGKAKSILLSASNNWLINHWKIIPSINVLLEDSEPYAQDKYTTHLIFPELDITYTLIDPTSWLKKFKFNWDGMVSREHYLSEIAMNKFKAKSELIFPLNNYMNFRLAASAGQLSSKNLDTVPLTLQFYTGGPYSLRGYSYNSIGPGRYVKNLSYELQFPITDLWGTFVFLDEGIASNHWSDKMKRGVGLGVSMNFKIVNLQLSLGRPLDDKGEDFKVQFLVQSMS